ncbi:PREDICTED: sulfhydryl oxidase 1-like [Crocodylus porosus]|nr:PREDICTED: sulfhydryl oxidase 1-like [Crocodylus porosus]
MPPEENSGKENEHDRDEKLRWVCVETKMNKVRNTYIRGLVKPEVGLYSAADPLVLLGAATLERSVLNSSSAWAVEFYASWCGHCKHFAPMWRALAADILEWRPAVVLGAFNCADESHQKVCGDFGITGFPTLKFFKAFSKSPEDGKRLYPGDSLPALRQSVITNLERHQDAWPPACPPLEPASTGELRGFFQRNNVTYLALIFEKNDSFVGREVILDMQQYENIAVRRVLSSEEELVKKYSVTTFPSAYLLVSNGFFSRISVQMEARSFYTYFLRRVPGVTRGSYKLTLLPSTENTTTPAPVRHADSSKLYMADLESALHYSLRGETERFSVLEGERLAALKHYVTVLAKYFPGRPYVKNFLVSLDTWLKNQKESNISCSALEEALKNKKKAPKPAILTHTMTWVGCQGSKSHFRGYPCSLWILFHLLTVQASKYKAWAAEPLEVLGAMRGYIRYFFGCRTCSEHFEAMAAESMNQVKSLDEAILWLWSRHNRANARLAGDLTEDPKFPKMQWPPPDMCPSCHNEVSGQHVWNEPTVLRFLKIHYSPANIYFDYTEPERILLARQSREVEVGDGEKVIGDGRTDMQRKERGENRREEDIEEEEEAEERRAEEPDGVMMEREVGILERRELHRPSIIRMNPRVKELEEDIVDLDSFSEQHFKSKALKEAALAASRKRRLSKRDTIPLLMADDDGHQAFDYVAAWERLRRRGLDSKQLVGALEEEGSDSLRKSQWFRVLGLGFSRLDVSLCIILYCLSSVCLLGMYTFFRMRLRSRKGRPGFPVA